MKLFSQRKGFKPVKSVTQVDYVDSELRNGLWDALVVFYWNQVEGRRISYNRNMDILFKSLWHSYFKEPIDTLEDYWSKTYMKIRDYVFKCEWYEVYDFIEFIANNYPDKYNKVNPEFMNFCNSVLERELSAYRFV